MFSAGQQIGHYTLLQKLGRGGFGEVWLAEKRTQFITKKVAVKLPFNEKIDFQAIQQEATLWEQASGHPNVLPIIDADIYDGQVVIVCCRKDARAASAIAVRHSNLRFSETVVDNVSSRAGEGTSQISLGFPKSDHADHDFMIGQGEFLCDRKLWLGVPRIVSLHRGEFPDFCAYDQIKRIFAGKPKSDAHSRQ